jgi:hypothetical protein
MSYTKVGISYAQRSSVWRSVTKASAERQVILHIFLNIRNTVKMFFHYKKLIFIKHNFLHKNFLYSH